MRRFPFGAVSLNAPALKTKMVRKLTEADLRKFAQKQQCATVGHEPRAYNEW